MDKLMEYQAAFCLEDVQRNVLLPFTLPQDYEQLAVRLHYGPKEVRDPEIIRPRIEECVRKYFPPGVTLTEKDMEEYPCLLNFVTLSLDCGEEYVGCAHRHPPDQTILVSEREASPGFFRRRAGKGPWRVVLHVQAVVAGTVDCHVAVFGLKGGERVDEIPAV